MTRLGFLAPSLTTEREAGETEERAELRDKMRRAGSPPFKARVILAGDLGGGCEKTL